ncbi:MAG: fumarylacetoacetate hydrolase family protein [Rhodospirillaceae bacterium]
MKLASFSAGDKERFGAVLENGIIDLSTTLVDGREIPTLREAIGHEGTIESFREAIATADQPDFGLEEIKFRLPIPNPRKIFCVGRNYRAYHEVLEDGRPDWPSIFPRFVDSFSAHGEPIVRGKDDGDQLDYEGELVAVIGKSARHVTEKDALSHVGGYTVANEGSVRNWIGRGTQNCPVKNQWRSGSMGPWIVTADEVPDITTLTIHTEVNGETRQHGGTDMMIFDLPFVISYISRFTPLSPGDCICTGSPGGSAIEHDPPGYLTPGNVLEVSIDGIGSLRNIIEAEV